LFDDFDFRFGVVDSGEGIEFHGLDEASFLKGHDDLEDLGFIPTVVAKNGNLI
jgi:hypothetical protein